MRLFDLVVYLPILEIFSGLPQSLPVVAGDLSGKPYTA